MKIEEIRRAIQYTLESNEIHAWTLSIHDSQNEYYIEDYDNAADFEDDIIMHLLQYGIEAVNLISHDINLEQVIYRIASIFDYEVDNFNDAYFRLRRIEKDNKK